MENQMEEAKRELAAIDPYDLGPTRAERAKTYQDNCEKLVDSRRRSWLKRRTGDKYIVFSDKDRNHLRKYFLSLDNDGSGSIGVEELVDPLIALGLADSMEQVQQMVDIVDTDGSGEIEFPEFLELINSGESNEMAAFFKGIINGSLIEGADVLPFNLVVGFYRRQRLLDAVTGENQEKKLKGEKVLKAYSKYVEQKKAKESRRKSNGGSSIASSTKPKGPMRF